MGSQQERKDNLHSKVKRVLAIEKYYKEREKTSDSVSKAGVFVYEGKELISINGRVKSSYQQQGKRPSVSEKAKKPKKRPDFGKKAAAAAAEDPGEVKEVAQARKSINALTANMQKIA